MSHGQTMFLLGMVFMAILSPILNLIYGHLRRWWIGRQIDRRIDRELDSLDHQYTGPRVAGRPVYPSQDAWVAAVRRTRSQGDPE